jgi:hypothetical protein
MKFSKAKGKVSHEHPMHKLYDAASDIVGRTMQAHKEAGVPVPESYCLPVWIDADRVMKITIEVGSQTTADYAIFKAQHKGKGEQA